MQSIKKLNLIQWLVTRLSIKGQIRIGFTLMLAILMLVSLNSIHTLGRLDNGIGEVASHLQPLVLSAQSLETEIEAAAHALGFLLLTRDSDYRDRYAAHLERAGAMADEMLRFEYVREDAGYRQTLTGVRDDLSQLAEYRDQIFQLLADDLLNSPAQKIASESLNPMARQLQGMIGQMIDSDYDEDNFDAERDAFRRDIYDLRYYNAQLMGELRTFLAFRGQASAANMQSIIDVIGLRLDSIVEAEWLFSFEQEEVVPLLVELYAEYFTLLDRAIDVHASDRYRTDIYLVNTAIGPLSRKIQLGLGELVQQLNQRIATTSSDLQDAASAVSRGMVIGLVVSVILGVGVSWFIVFLMSVPLDAAVRAMRDLAEGEGNLNHRLDEKGRSEVAEMARYFNSFASKVQALMGPIGNGIANLSDLVARVSRVVEQTREGAEIQREQTGHVSSAMTEMSSSTQAIATSANQAAAAAKIADDNVNSGQAVVAETVAAINELAAEIEIGASVIQGLSEEVDSIGNVLDVIKGIADQTNLLALNAAIEAARAGEQGRGFAVVADEVRTLASRTHDSTTEIESMIEKLSNQAHSAVVAITGGQTRARASVETASNAGTALREIIASVATIRSMNTQIATASEEQSAVAAEIRGNVSNIAEVAGKNAEASQSLAETSVDLARLADELQKVAASFRY